MPPNQLKDLHLFCILILSFKLRCFGWFIYLEVLFDWCDWAHARTNQLSPFNAPQTHTHTLNNFAPSIGIPGICCRWPPITKNFAHANTLKSISLAKVFDGKMKLKKKIWREREKKRNETTVPNLNCFVCARHNESQKIGKTWIEL